MKETQMMGRIVCVLVVFSSLNQSSLAAVKEDYYNLYNFLFKDTDYPYEKNIRPALNESHVITVFINFYMNSIIDVDEKEQTLVTSGSLLMVWEDSLLSWDSFEYGHIVDLLVPQSIIYLPDIIVGNSVRTTTQLGYPQQQVRLTESGQINWEPNLLMVTACDIDITYFPFDTQICFIVFETAVTSNSEIILQMVEKDTVFSLKGFSLNGQWQLVAVSAEDHNQKGHKASVQFGLQLKRRRVFYLLNIVLPIFFLSLTSSLVFALPADEGEKMGTGITILLSFAVYLTVVSDLVPNTSLQVSFLAVYLTTLTGMCAISVVVCSFILRLHFRDEDLPVGPKTTRITRILQQLTCSKKDGDVADNKVVPIQREEESQDKTHHKDNPELLSNKSGAPWSIKNICFHEDTNPVTWKDVAKTMDKFCFIIFTLLTVFTTVICLLILIIGGELNAAKLDSPIKVYE